MINPEVELDNNVLTTEDDMYFFAYDLGERKHFSEAISIFYQLYNPKSSKTLRKGLCMVAEYFESQQMKFEAINWYQHALQIDQSINPDEDLKYYQKDYIANKIQSLQNIKNKYKIALYAICGNEMHNLKEGVLSIQEADYICILDTGSTDGSYEFLKDFQNQHPDKVFLDQKTYNPGRFDAPRNDSLKLVPSDADICICIDPDERLVSGGAEKIREAWHPQCERLYYLYAGSHLQNGQPARVFWYDKVHRNSGEGYWKFPVHEALYHNKYKHADLKTNQYVFLPADYIMLHHYPQYKESRKNYLPLIEMRYNENPDDFYSNIYLAHEYVYTQEYQKDVDFILNKALPYYLKNDVEAIYLSNLYMFLGDAYCALNQNDLAIQQYQTAVQTDPTYRDPYLHLAKLYIQIQQDEQAIDIINNCFKQSHQYISGLEGDTTGLSKPWELLTYAYQKINAIEMARQCAQIAIAIDPANTTLKKNLEQVVHEN